MSAVVLWLRWTRVLIRFAGRVIEHLDQEHAAAMVAARTGAPLSEVLIIDITD